MNLTTQEQIIALARLALACYATPHVTAVRAVNAMASGDETLVRRAWRLATRHIDKFPTGSSKREMLSHHAVALCAEAWLSETARSIDGAVWCAVNCLTAIDASREEEFWQTVAPVPTWQDGDRVRWPGLAGSDSPETGTVTRTEVTRHSMGDAQWFERTYVAWDAGVPSYVSEDTDPDVIEPEHMTAEQKSERERAEWASFARMHD